MALVVCDANNLKKINDTKGHVAGDEYLKQSAMILCEIFDRADKKMYEDKQELKKEEGQE